MTADATSGSSAECGADVTIGGHYDAQADIAWLRFEGYDPASVVAEETDFGLRELDPADDRLGDLEYWRASKTLPDEFLSMLPAPPLHASR